MTHAEELRQKLETVRQRLEGLTLSDSDAELLSEHIDRLLGMVMDSEAGGTRARSVMEWWGVGKAFWGKMDVDEYIRKERESWR